MKTIDEEFGIIRGGLVSFNGFQGETPDHHGFFIHNNNLCWKCNYDGQPVDCDSADYYNRLKNRVDEYWWGISDGDFKDDIIMIHEIKYIPFVFVEHIRKSKWHIIKHLDHDNVYRQSI